jgi:hypothetical protein
MLRHDWLAHGPTLSVRLNSTTTTATSSSVSLADQQGHNDYEKVRLRTTPTKIHDKSLSPTNSLVELELHTSSFFDTARLRNNTNNNNSSNKNNNDVIELQLYQIQHVIIHQIIQKQIHHHLVHQIDDH